MSFQLFRFATPRSAVPVKKVHRKNELYYDTSYAYFLRVLSEVGTSSFHAKLLSVKRQFSASGANNTVGLLEDWRKLAKSYLEEDSFVLNDPYIDISSRVERAYTLMLNAGASLDADYAIELLTEALGQAPESFVSSNFLEFQIAAWNSLFATLIYDSSHANGTVEPLLSIIRTLNLLKVILEREDQRISSEEIYKYIRAIVLLPTEIFPLPHNNVDSVNSDSSKTSSQESNDLSDLGKRLRDLDVAVSGLNQVENSSNSKLSAIVRGLILGNEQIQALDLAQVQTILSKEGIDITNQSFLYVKDKALQRREQIANQTRNLTVSRRAIFLGRTILNKSTIFKSDPIKSTPPLRSVVNPLGVFDLRLVRQTLKRYQLGEISHVENVLQTELRERKHRWLRRVEETETTESERLEDRTRDIQTTDRFEIQREAQASVQESESVKAGLTVSASYGTVSVEANASYGRETSREESSRFASNYSQEVIDRAIDRVTERVRVERIRKTTEEVEENNLHSFNNADGSGNVIGIYRWLEKVYEAQIVNYGKRLNFDLTIPEPAAFYIYSLQQKEVDGLTVEPPPDISTLSPASITETRYQELIRDYRLEGVEPPPAAEIVISKAYSKTVDESPEEPGGSSSVIILASDELTIPDGYKAIRANVEGTRLATADSGHRLVFVGNVGVNLSLTERPWRDLNPRDPDPTFSGESDLPGLTSKVSISLGALDYRGVSMTVAVTCVRTDANFQAWQNEVYTAVIERHRELERAYRDQLTVLRSRSSVSVTGRNPAFNREIEKTELKKQCISLLSNQNYDSFDAMRPGVGTSAYPEMDIPESIEEGRVVRFFEECFEWDNMTYLFYPYFWSRKDSWVDRSLIDDKDPVFSSFLKAGSARVMLPVRPGYEKAVLFYLYMETGDVPPPGDLPIPERFPECIDILEELAEGKQLEQDPISEGEPREVVVPTSLVILQEDSSLPEF